MRMGIVTYNFVGATSPAPADGHKLLMGVATALPAPDVGSEAPQGEYDAIEADDALRAQVSTIHVNDLPYHQCRFYITKPPGLIYTNFAMSALGYGGWGTLRYWELFIRNLTSGLWESLGSHNNDGDATLSGSRSSSLGSYMSGDYVWLATTGPVQTLANPSTDYCNYVKLVVTTGPPSGGLPPGHGGAGGGSGGGGKQRTTPLGGNVAKWQMGDWNGGWDVF